jgi:hypothetical protein
LLGVVFIYHAAPARAAAGINQQINFQGRLLNSQGATVPDGFYNIEFKIYQDGDGQSAGDTTGSPAGSLKWTEDHINNNSQGVTVKNGYFSVQLGSVTAFGSNIDWNQDTLWLSINIGTTNATCTPFSSCGGDGEMTPMKRLSSSPYALNSGQLGGLTSAQFVQLARGVQTDASTNTTSIFLNKTGGGNFFQLQSSSTDVFTLSNSGDIAFGSNANHTISVATAAANGAGKSLTISSGAAGTGGAALAGGNLVLQGGAGGGTNGNGGNVSIDAGAKNGSGTDGTISIGTVNSSAVSIAKSGVTTTVNGDLNLANGVYKVGGTTVIDASRNISNVGTISTSGTINSQTLGAASNFTGTVTVQGASLTIGTGGTTTGSLKLANNVTGRMVILQGLNPSGSGDATIQFPSIAGGATDTVCLLTANNCNAVTSTSGLQNYITKYNNAGATQITKSQIFDNGTSVIVGGTTTAGAALFNVGATNQFQVSSAGAVTAVGLDSGTGVIQGTGGAIIAGTITFSSINTAGILHATSSGVVSSSGVVLGTDTTGSYVASLGTLTGLSTTGNSGAGATPTLSVTYGSAANTAVQGNTQLTCPSGTGNLTGGGDVITLGTGGTCSNLTVVNNPTFSGLITANGGLSVATSNTFTNAGSTLNTAKAIGDKPTGGTIGTAANTVDSATNFAVSQTTASQTLTIPTPTVATGGRTIYISNTGSVTFTIKGATVGAQSAILPVGEGRTFIWDGTDWTLVNNVNAGTGLTRSGNTLNSAAATSVVNDTNIQGSIASNALTLSWAGTLSVSRGGTGASSFTTNGILYGGGANINVTAAAANSVLITNGSNTPSLSQTLPSAVQGNITSTGALAAGSIASGFGTITTANTIQGTVITGSTGFAITGASTVGHYLRNNGTNYVDSALQAGDISGTLFTVAASAGTSQTIASGGTVSILKGSSNNLTTTAGATGNVTVDIVSNPTFGGDVTSSTKMLSPQFDVATAGTLSLGTGTASAISIGKVGVATTNVGDLSIGASAGTGTLFTNNGATQNSALSLGNFISGGSIGSAASTVDKYTYITINQTSTGQTLTLPSPTSGAAGAGRIIYISNIGSASFIVLGVTINNGTSAALIWNGSAWTFGDSRSLQSVYNASVGGTTPKIKVDSTRGGVDIQDADTTIGGSLLTVRASNSGGLGTALFDLQSTGVATFRPASNSGSTFQVQNASGVNIVVVDSNNRQLKVMENAGSTNYALIYYDTATSTANYTASAGTVAVGTGSGAISIISGSGAAITVTANAASTWKTTAGTLTLQSGTSSDLILNPGSSIVSVNGASVVKLGSSAGDPATCTLGAIVYNSTTNLFRGCQGSTPAWATLSSTTQTLQNTYTASTGGTTPEIKVDSTRGGVDIQDADSTIGGILFAVRGSNAGGLGTSLLNVNSSNSTVNIGTAATSTALLVLGSDTDSTFNAGTASNVPTVVNGAMFYSSTDHNFMCGTAGSWITCNGLLYSNTAVGSTISSCTTACGNLGSAPIPANYCQPGRVIHVNARGRYGSTGAPTLQMEMRYGTSTTRTSDTLIGVASPTATVALGASNMQWTIDFKIICFSTTSMDGQGIFYLQTGTASTSNQFSLFNMSATASTTGLTTSAAANLYLFPVWNTNNAANTVVTDQYIVTAN